MPYIPHGGVLTVGSWEEVRAVLEAADDLAALAASGRKTATASAFPLYELEQEQARREGAGNVARKQPAPQD